jgi:hypothetical protein
MSTFNDGGVLNVVTGSFIGQMVEGVLWGGNVVLVGLAMFVFFWNRKGKSTNPYLVTATLVLFAFSTLHCWLEFVSLYLGLFANYYPTSESPLNRASDTLWSLTDFVGQLVMVYRLYLVWNKNLYIIILPTLLVFLSVGAAMAGVGIQALSALDSAYAPPSLIPIGDLAFCVPLGFQIIVTSLIVGKIFVISRNVDSSRSTISSKSSKAGDAIGILIESGFLLLVIQILFVVYFTEQSPVQSIIYGMAAQIYAIAPTLIIVRVGLAGAFTDGSTFSRSHGSQGTASFSKSCNSRVQLNQQVVSFSDRGYKADDIELGVPSPSEDKMFTVSS